MDRKLSFGQKNEFSYLSRLVRVYTEPNYTMTHFLMGHLYFNCNNFHIHCFSNDSCLSQFEDTLEYLDAQIGVEYGEG